VEWLCPFGQKYADNTYILRAVKKKLTTIHQNYSKIIPMDLFMSIIDSHPNPYPSHKSMSPENDFKMALNGRRFELLQLSFVSEMCDCCSSIKPYHVDPVELYERKFQNSKGLRPTNYRHHFNEPYVDAFYCNCEEFCGGQQFYFPKCQVHVLYFLGKHSQLTQ